LSRPSSLLRPPPTPSRLPAVSRFGGYGRASFPFRSRRVGGPQLGPTTGPHMVNRSPPLGHVAVTCRIGRLWACRHCPPRGRGGSLQFPRHPSGRSTPPTPGGSSAPAPRSLVPSLAFASNLRARLPLVPLARLFVTTLQASLHAADRSVAPPRFDARPLGRRRGLHYRGPWRLPGPDLHRLAAVSCRSVSPLGLTSFWRRPGCWTHRLAGKSTAPVVFSAHLP